MTDHLIRNGTGKFGEKFGEDWGKVTGAYHQDVSLFSLPSDEGDNKYGPEPWDSKNEI